MKIGIDIRCLVEGKRTGVEEYTLSLLSNLFEIDKKNEYVLFLNSFGRPRIDFSFFEKYKNVKIKQFGYPNKLLNFCFWYLNWPKVDRMLGSIDLFFMPNINFVALSRKCNLIVTIHDLSFEIFKETFSIKRRLWHFFVSPKKLCMRADNIIAISDSTKNDLQTIYKIPSEKICRIYNGTSEEFAEYDRNDKKLIEVKEKYHLPFSFIFYLGTIEPRKNIIAIVRAFDQLKSTNHPQLEKYKLVIAGAKGWKVEQILNEMRGAQYNKDIIYTNQITNEDKPAVYNLASLFVYPSFFEGFGLPVLEAMKCRIPVITSNTSSLPEVVGDSALMIDPDRPDELYRAMQEMLLNKELANTLSEKQRWQAFKFNWKNCARQFLSVMTDDDKVNKNKRKR